jgi:hypothetical protein
MRREFPRELQRRFFERHRYRSTPTLIAGADVVALAVDLSAYID